MIRRQTVASVLTTTAIAFCIAHTPAQAADMASAAAPPDERDRSLQRDVKSALVADPALQQTHIAVFAEGGRVTLAGVVTTAEQRDRAQRNAMAVRGVRQVENAIEVTEP